MGFQLSGEERKLWEQVVAMMMEHQREGEGICNLVHHH
jgi:hypothetical protein